LLLVSHSVANFAKDWLQRLCFREHDVLFRQGIIATSTTVIPYNRIHVAYMKAYLHRYLVLKNRNFTAGYEVRVKRRMKTHSYQLTTFLSR
jgi:membrane protein YdbS with pleckstrin-like domain